MTGAMFYYKEASFIDKAKCQMMGWQLSTLKGLSRVPNSLHFHLPYLAVLHLVLH